MATVTKPMALDETLQRVATALETIAGGGGGGGDVGEFSQYQKVLVTPSDSDYITFANPFEVDPKYIQITCPSDSQAATSLTYIREGIFKFDTFGALRYYISNGGERGICLLRHNTPTSGSRFGYYDDKIRIMKATTDATFSTSTEYIVELYA